MNVKTLNRTICGVALVALSGCAPQSPPPPPASPPAAQNGTLSGPIVLVAPAAPVPAKPAPPPKRHEDRKTTPATAAAPPPPPAVQLVGMDEGALQALLGPPSLVEDHAPGKTWRFRKQGCVLSVALYPDVQTRVFRTLSYEVTSDEHNTGAKQLCETKFGSVALAE